MAKKTRKARKAAQPKQTFEDYFAAQTRALNIPPPPVDPPPPPLPSAVAFVEQAAAETIQQLHALRSRLDIAGLLTPAQGATGGAQGAAPAPMLLSGRLEDVGRALHGACGEILADINVRLQV